MTLNNHNQDQNTSKVGSKLMNTGALFALLSPIRNYLIIACIMAILGSALGLAPYIAIAEITKLILSNVNYSSQDIWLWVGFGIIGALLRLIFLFFSSRWGHYADAEILYKIRVRIVQQLGTIPLGWFREKGSGVIKKVMTSDLEEMHQLIAHSLREMLGAVTAIIIALIYLYLTNWKMTLVTVSVLLIMYISYRIAMRSVTTHMTRLLNAETKISTSAVEYADGITVVKTFGVGGKLLNRFEDAVKEHTNAFQIWVSETKYSSGFSRLFASEVTLLGVLTIAGLILVNNNTLSISDFLPFLIVGIGLPTSIIPAVHGSQGLRKGRLSASNIENLLSLETIPESQYPQEPQYYSIEFQNVSFGYTPDQKVIKNISFDCPQGTVTALVGKSGSGKSTIASLLPRFYDIQQGNISIGGIDIKQMASEKLLSTLSLVFQDIVLLNDSVRENIRIANPEATEEDIITAAKAAQIHEIIKQLPQGYDTLLGTGNNGLSGGEKQRLTLARAILSNAPIVILDEATASLDPDNEILVQQALNVLVKNKTVIMIAHRLYTISNAHQIIMLENGEIAEKGTHEQLINNQSLYSKMWEAQHVQ